ncbi:hypothetical protein [Pseudarthrobacter sp. WHRI 8279]|uniref:hypothetical protein n=1 Tax=Pseudarthrobacter sp. WHRI 8279 TaxID=3162566 RepID=UPI0032EEECE6
MSLLVIVLVGRVGVGQSGFLILASSGILLLAVPTSRFLSRRILIGLTTVFGVTPVLWWFPLPIQAAGRATFLVALLAAGLGAWVAYGEKWRLRLRSLLPEIRAIDFLPVVTALMSAGTLMNFLKTRTSVDALTLLTMNWDNASHFDMYYMLRTHGRTIGALGASPDGSAWQFHNYPQGFHATVALLAEFVRGPLPADLHGELVAYTVLSAVVSTMAATLVVAGLCSIPMFRRRFGIAAPAAIFVAAGWVYGPGAAATMHGFQNFYVAAALVAAFLVLMILQTKVFSHPLLLLASASAAVGVAHNWILLGSLLFGACVVILLPLNRRRWAASRFGYVLATGTAVFGFCALLLAVRQLSSVSAEDVLYAVGGVPIPDFGVVAALLLGTFGISLLVRSSGSSRLVDFVVYQPHRVANGAWAIVAGLIVLAVMAAAQISKSGALSYYSIKLILALELVALVVFALAVVAYLHSFPQRDLRRPWWKWTSVLALGLATTQCFGLTFDTRAFGLTPSAESALEIERQRVTLDSPVPQHVEALFRAVESNWASPAAYLTTYGKDFDAILAFQWYDALTGTYTEKSSAKLMPHLLPLWSGVEGLPTVVEALRREDPEVRIIVDPENQDLLRQLLSLSR